MSHTFIATADAIRMAGATPVFVDVDPRTGNMDPQLLGGAISSRTAAVLCVHQMGMPADLAAVATTAAHHGVPVVEDAACAAGSEYRCGEDRWMRIGLPHTAAACFSFHPRKLITTGEGGMVTTADPAIDARVRRARVHGMTIPAHERHTSATITFEAYAEPGFNFRLSDVAAAIGRVQLARLPSTVARRRALASRYTELLADIAGIEVAVEPPGARTNWQSFAVRLAEDIDQRSVMQGLLDRGVASRRGVMCVHREPAHPPGTWRAAGPLAHSEAAQDRGVILPLSSDMTEHEQVAVASALAEVTQR